MVHTATDPLDGRRQDAGQVAAWLRLFVRPGEVTELRAVKVRQRYGRPATVSGFFDAEHLGAMAAEALRLEKDAEGVYFTLNPVNPALLGRRYNRAAVADEGETTSDRDVVRRRWLLLDADPVRPAKVSSTDAEKALAWEVIRRARDFLAGRGWPATVLADSGNGYHLLYAIDLPCEDGRLVERCLLALAGRFDTDAVKIDRKVFNPARITKLYGTLTGKGDAEAARIGRPHRRSGILEVPG